MGEIYLKARWLFPLAESIVFYARPPHLSPCQTEQKPGRIPAYTNPFLSKEENPFQIQATNIFIYFVPIIAYL